MNEAKSLPVGTLSCGRPRPVLLLCVGDDNEECLVLLELLQGLDTGAKPSTGSTYTPATYSRTLSKRILCWLHLPVALSFMVCLLLECWDDPCCLVGVERNNRIAWDFIVRKNDEFGK